MWDTEVIFPIKLLRNAWSDFSLLDFPNERTIIYSTLGYGEWRNVELHRAIYEQAQNMLWRLVSKRLAVSLLTKSYQEAADTQTMETYLLKIIYSSSPQLARHCRLSHAKKPVKKLKTHSLASLSFSSSVCVCSKSNDQMLAWLVLVLPCHLVGEEEC